MCSSAESMLSFSEVVRVPQRRDVQMCDKERI